MCVLLGCRGVGRVWGCSEGRGAAEEPWLAPEQHLSIGTEGV